MIADKDEHIKTILSVIPEKPGCYQYFDENGTIIYVGKAKNLKRRVSSYFNKVHDSNKTRVLVNPGYQIYSRRYGRRRVTTGKQPHQTVSSPL